MPVLDDLLAYKNKQNNCRKGANEEFESQKSYYSNGVFINGDDLLCPQDSSQAKWCDRIVALIFWIQICTGIRHVPRADNLYTTVVCCIYLVLVPSSNITIHLFLSIILYKIKIMKGFMYTLIQKLYCLGITLLKLGNKNDQK